MNLKREAVSVTKLLRGKSVKVVRRPRTSEILIEFTDGTRLFADAKTKVEISVTGTGDDKE